MLISILERVYNMATVFVPALFLYHFKEKNKNKIKLLELLILCYYIYLVLRVTGIGTIYDIGKYEGLFRKEEIEWIPFVAGGYYTHIYNIVMMVPYGFLYGLLSREGNLKRSVFSSFGLSLLIELSQLLNRRTTGTDDLLMNTLGGFLGYMLYLIFSKVINYFLKKDKRTYYPYKFHMPIYTYVYFMFFGKFFFFNWRLLY